MSRDWCFTAWTQVKYDEDKIRYIIIGEEICPESKKLHFQGYVVFNRTCRIPKAKEWLGGDKTIHLEAKMGTRVQARDYCKKDNKFIEYGHLEALSNVEILRLPVNKIKEDHPLMYCRYHRGIEKLHMEQGAKWRDVKVTVLWGQTGTGKTRTVMSMDDVFKIDPPYTWWDGYYGESILLIDDYKKGDIKRGMFLNMLDGYRLRLETKGGHTWALWKHVYITTNSNPDYFEDAVLRRVTSVEAVG